MRALVVDDDPAVRQMIADALDLEGYEVRTANDGADALRALESWQPSVIVLDLMMPVMDGFAFRAAQRAHAEARDVPVIVVSAARDLDDRTRDMAAEAVLTKPFDLEVLLDTVARVAGSAGS